MIDIESEKEVLHESRDLLAGARSLILASVDDQGAPLASYAPFVADEAGAFYIFVSSLARHAATLRNGRVSIMIIQDESSARQIFARPRLTFDCVVEEVARTEEPAADILQRLRQRHGPVMEMLASHPIMGLAR